VSEPVKIEDDGRVKIIRFNRVEKKNAITQKMYAMMADAMHDAEVNGSAAIVFLGHPGVFTAGNDIMDFMANAMTQDFANSPTLRFLRALATCQIPMIAGVDGLAIGVGATMLMHCDMVFASPRTTLKTPFLNLGLVPEAASSLIAPRLMGTPRAFEILVMGEVFTASAARDAGLVNHVVDEAGLEAETMKAAHKLAAIAPEALRLSRGLLRGDPAEILRRIDEEAELFTKRLQSDEAREAFTAFIEKRPPNFNKTTA